MSSWAIVAIVAIIVGGLTSMMRARHGITIDRKGNELREKRDDPETRRELDDLRERIKVLERIATDGNSLDARETERIAAEIESLREKQG